MTYTNAQGQGLSWSDELGAVVVADLGSGIPPAVFYASVPGNLGENNVDSLVSSLQASALQPQPAGGGPPGDGGAPAATADDARSPPAAGGQRQRLELASNPSRFRLFTGKPRFTSAVAGGPRAT